MFCPRLRRNLRAALLLFFPFVTRTRQWMYVVATGRCLGKRCECRGCYGTDDWKEHADEFSLRTAFEGVCVLSFHIVVLVFSGAGKHPENGLSHGHLFTSLCIWPVTHVCMAPCSLPCFVDRRSLVTCGSSPAFSAYLVWELAWRYVPEIPDGSNGRWLRRHVGWCHEGLVVFCKLVPEADDGSNEEVLTNAFLNILMGCSEDGSVVTWGDVLKVLMGCCK